MGGLKWVGGRGQYVPGVPARDLTAAEAKAHRAALEAHPAAAAALYEAPDESERSEAAGGARKRAKGATGASDGGAGDGAASDESSAQAAADGAGAAGESEG